MMRLAGNPSAYAFSLVRALARRRRIIDVDDVREACDGVNITEEEIRRAVSEGVNKHLLHPQPGRRGRFRSLVYAT